MNRFLEVVPLMRTTKKQAQAEQVRKEVVETFNREKLKVLTLEEYAIGHSDNANFCYCMEIKLRELGNIQGGFARKFAVYYSASGNEYAWTRWTKGDFSVVRDMLVDLYDAGARHDVAAIISNEFSPMFKGKILSTYFPERYVNVFAEYHLIYFLEQLDISYDKKMNVVIFRELLMDYKNAQKELAELSAVEFGNLLYGYFGSPSEKEVTRNRKEAEWLSDEVQNIKIDSKLVTNVATKEYSEIPVKRPQKKDVGSSGIYSRNSDKSIQALTKANYRCEIDKSHLTFMRRDNVHAYTEAHHLIPMSAQDDFEFTLDTTANIVSLCSHCHNCIHYGFDWEGLLQMLYDARKDRLKTAGLSISFNALKRYYSK